MAASRRPSAAITAAGSARGLQQRIEVGGGLAGGSLAEGEQAQHRHAEQADQQHQLAGARRAGGQGGIGGRQHGGGEEHAAEHDREVEPAGGRRGRQVSHG
ncbi:MAG: hypothetical protein WDN45_05005 [Caulobacteraceae bacterium]